MQLLRVFLKCQCVTALIHLQQRPADNAAAGSGCWKEGGGRFAFLLATRRQEESPKVFPKLCLDTELGCGANVSEGEAAASLAAPSTLGLGAVQKAKPCSSGSAFCWEGIPSGLALSVAKVKPL